MLEFFVTSAQKAFVRSEYRRKSGVAPMVDLNIEPILKPAAPGASEETYYNKKLRLARRPSVPRTIVRDRRNCSALARPNSGGSHAHEPRRRPATTRDTSALQLKADNCPPRRPLALALSLALALAQNRQPPSQLVGNGAAAGEAPFAAEFFGQKIDEGADFWGNKPTLGKYGLNRPRRRLVGRQNAFEQAVL